MALPLGRDSVMWRVVSEPVVVLASGGPALLLQVAHPAVAAGVEQHSDYKSNPWERLFKTLDTMFVIAFGSPAESQARARQLRGGHARINGTTDDGTPYRALDPDLLLWVWATLADTPLRAYERFVGPLPAADRARFYAEQVDLAHACGVPEGRCPPDLDAFAAYVASMHAELRVTDAAREVAAAIVGPPLPRPLLPVSIAAGAVLGPLTASMLPRELRRAYGLPWDPARRQVLRAAVLASRLGARIVPGPLRRLPATLAA